MEIARRGRPAAGALVVLVPLAVTVLVRLPQYVVNSDSVAQQTILGTWRRTGHDVTYVPQDTWILKVPVYLLVEALPLAPRTRLAVESVAFEGIGLCLVALALAAMLRLLRHAPAAEPGTPEPGAQAAGPRTRPLDVLLPAAWLGTVGGVLGQFVAVMPNHRNIELGLGLLLLVAVGTYLSPGRREAGPWALAAGTAGAALLWLDDPYIAYLIGAPLLVACLALAVRRAGAGRRRAVTAAALLGVSLLALPLLRRGLDLLGVHVVQDAAGPAPDRLAHHLRQLWPAFAALLNLPRALTGHDLAGSPSAVAGTLTAAVLVAAVPASALVAFRAWRAGNLALAVLAAGWPLVPVAFVLHPAELDVQSGRYLLLAVVELVACLGAAAALLRRRRPRVAAAIVGLLAVATVANLGSTLHDRVGTPPETSRQDATAQVLRSTGAAHGLAEFWSADLYTWLTDGAVQFSEVECSGHRLRRRGWLNDTARLRLAGHGSVVLWDETSPKSRGCTVADVTAQLGPPATTQPLPGGGVLLRYASDVTPRLDPAPPSA